MRWMERDYLLAGVKRKGVVEKEKWKYRLTKEMGENADFTVGLTLGFF